MKAIGNIFKEYVIPYGIHRIVLFIGLPILFYLILFHQPEFTVDANSAFWIFGTIVTGFMTLLGLLTLVASNMSRKMGEIRTMTDRYLSGADPGLRFDMNLFFEGRISNLRGWFSTIWFSYFGLIAYCLIMMISTITESNGRIYPVWLFGAIWWAFVNLIISYALIMEHLIGNAQSSKPIEPR